MKNNTLMRSSLLAFAMIAAGNNAAAETVVVVSAKSGAGALTADQVADIFLGKSNALPGGGQAVPIDQADGALRDDFYAKASGKTAAGRQVANLGDR